jgi:hypothetical protein
MGRIGPLEGVQMAGTADITIAPVEQPLVVAGMGRMAGDTAVFTISNQVIMRGGHLRFDVFMTVKTGIDPHRSISDMAVTTPGGIGIMQNIADQTRIVTAVGAMTGAAVSELAREIAVFAADGLEAVTTQAKCGRFLDQQPAVVGLMRRMAAGAFALGIGLVSIFKLFGQAGMTGKTGFRRPGIEQPRLVRRMGIMAGETFTFTDRLVNHRLVKSVTHVVVAVETQPGDRLLNQPFVRSDMGIMTGKAFTIRHRLMFYFPFKGITIVTGETVHLRQRCSLSRQQQQSTWQDDSK